MSVEELDGYFADGNFRYELEVGILGCMENPVYHDSLSVVPHFPGSTTAHAQDPLHRRMLHLWLQISTCVAVDGRDISLNMFGPSGQNSKSAINLLCRYGTDAGFPQPG